jgi:hypothetical protein
MESARGPPASYTGVLLVGCDSDIELLSAVLWSQLSVHVSNYCIVQVKRAKTWTEAVEQLKPLVLKNGGI